MAQAENQEIIVVIEDSPEDFEIIKRALHKNEIMQSVKHFFDGDEALKFLKETHENDNVNVSFVLLDLNLPGRGGREILSLIKGHRGYQSLPVVVLTTSSYEDDIAACSQSGASRYIQKPLSFTDFIEALKPLKGYVN